MRGRLALTVALLAQGCSEQPIASLSAQVVVDRNLMTFVQVFQLYALRATTTDGQSVTCDDFPSPFQIGNPRLQACFGDDEPALQQGCRAQISWSGEPSEAKLGLTVPLNERLLFVARGLANTSSGPFIVARGCAENVEFNEAKNHVVKIDVLASTGKPCFDVSDCELNGQMICHRDAHLPGNYCAKIRCNADSDCLPGSVCVLDVATGGLCARPCDTVADCKGTGQIGPHPCEGRTGPGGCRTVCVWPDWNKSTACTPN